MKINLIKNVLSAIACSFVVLQGVDTGKCPSKITLEVLKSSDLDKKAMVLDISPQSHFNQLVALSSKQPRFTYLNKLSQPAKTKDFVLTHPSTAEAFRDLNKEHNIIIVRLDGEEIVAYFIPLSFQTVENRLGDAPTMGVEYTSMKYPVAIACISADLDALKNYNGLFTDIWVKAGMKTKN